MKRKHTLQKEDTQQKGWSRLILELWKYEYLLIYFLRFWRIFLKYLFLQFFYFCFLAQD